MRFLLSNCIFVTGQRYDKEGTKTDLICIGIFKTGFWYGTEGAWSRSLASHVYVLH